MRAKAAIFGALAALALLPPPTGGAAEGPPTLTESEIRAALALGPWPAPDTSDPRNRVSGKAEAIEFGERLFFDTRLSGSGKFKVPTLRHLLLTAPYGHHGQFETIADVLKHYSEQGGAEIKPLKLTASEQTDLVVFLESVSTMANPWRPDDGWRCR